MDTSLLFPAGFQVLRTIVSQKVVELDLTFTTLVGNCPLCQTPSSRIHSCYRRRLKDLPMSGKPVTLTLWVRKFFCDRPCCPRKIFAQQFESALKPYAQRLNRVDDQAQSLGLLIGSKPGARMCHLVGMALSASTLLRIMKKTPLPEVVSPAVLGVDDFAFHKRTRYGTILVDLEKRCPIDLLPDREGKTLEEWLKAHPGVKTVIRDRSLVYANAITTVCPDAIQVADRWHLLKNLSENMIKFLDTRRVIIRQVVQQVANQQGAKMLQLAKMDLLPVPGVCINDVGLLEASTTQKAVQQASVLEVQPTEIRYVTYQQVKALQSQGHGKKAIARHLHISRNTVRKYFRQDIFAPRPIVKRSNLLDYEPYLHQRWQQGITCGRTLLK